MRIVIMREKYTKQYFNVNGIRLSAGEIMELYDCNQVSENALSELLPGDTVVLNTITPPVIITPYT